MDTAKRAREKCSFLRDLGTPAVKRVPVCRRIRLKPRKILKCSAAGVARLVALGVILLLAVSVFAAVVLEGGYTDRVINWGLVVIAVLAASKVCYQALHYLLYFYDIDDDYVVIRKGVLAKREAILPVTRITDVWVERDIGDVVMGLYDVHISTPTAESGRFAHISGVDKHGAVRLRRLILDKIHGMA